MRLLLVCWHALVLSVGCMDFCTWFMMYSVRPALSASNNSCGRTMYHVAKQAQSSFIKTMTERGFLHS